MHVQMRMQMRALPIRIALQCTHAATAAYGCSPRRTRLQPAVPTVAASLAYGCSFFVSGGADKKVKLWNYDEGSQYYEG